ncbi:MAG: TolC family protein [Cytophagales bacterium]|nr:TolC family protein [Cytophagales bacterium]
MKTFIPLLSGFLLILINQAYGQSSFTMATAVQYAIDHNETLKNIKIDKEIAHVNVKQTQSKYYPQLSGSADFRNNVILPTSILPAGIAGPEARAVQFGQRYNTSVGLDGSINIFDPTLQANVKSQQIQELITENNYKSTKRDLIVSVKKAYYSALLNKKKISYYTESLKRTKKVYEDASTLYKSNQNLSIDLEKANIDLKNQEADLKKARQLYEQSLFVLKYNMGYPADSVLNTLDTMLLEDASISIPSTISRAGASNRIQYKTTSLYIQQEEFNLRKNKNAYLPTLSLYGYLGAQNINQNIDYSKNWYGLAYFGAKLAVPIFDGFSKSHSVANSKLNQLKRKNELAQLEKQYNYETNYYRMSLQNTLENLEARKNSLTLTEKQLQNTQNRYNAGLVVIKEVVESQTKLAEAQANYLSALNDYLNAKIDLEKAEEIVE